MTLIVHTTYNGKYIYKYPEYTFQRISGDPYNEEEYRIIHGDKVVGIFPMRSLVSIVVIKEGENE